MIKSKFLYNFILNQCDYRTHPEDIAYELSVSGNLLEKRSYLLDWKDFRTNKTAEGEEYWKDENE